MKPFFTVLLSTLLVAPSVAQKKTKVIQSGFGGDFYEINKIELPNYDSTIFVYHTLDGKEYRVYRDKRNKKNKYFYFKNDKVNARKKRIKR
jgi:hypothetical protein